MPRFTLLAIATTLALVVSACGSDSSTPQSQPDAELSANSTTTEAVEVQSGDDLASLLDQDDASPSTSTSATPDADSATGDTLESGSAPTPDSSAPASATTAPPSTAAAPEEDDVEGDCVTLPDLAGNCFPLLRLGGEIILVDPLSDDERAEFQFACVYQDNAEACEVLEFFGPGDGVGNYYSMAPTEVLQDECENLTGVEQKLACAEIATR
jgi:hypothetical protein